MLRKDRPGKMKFDSPLKIYKILPKTNCKQCNAPSCMAFSAAVFKGQQKIADCPYVDRDTIVEFEAYSGSQSSMELQMADLLKDLKEKIKTMNFLLRSQTMGAESDGEKITIKCMGKEFEIDTEGNLASQCHTHIWFAIPLFSYLLFGAGKDPSGEWVPFRELKNGAMWNPLFEQRCEKPLKKIADANPDLFEILISIFSGTRTSFNALPGIKADISVMLYPFPKVPILICYWKPEDGMKSELHLFFDSTVEDNLSIEVIYSLGMGMASMLEKIMLKHI